MDAHRGAFEYDWRTRFHLPLTVVGESMSFGEALRLSHVLRSDPSSAITAALEGWTNPVSRESLVLMDLFDLHHRVNSKKQPDPHPSRPWPQDGKRVERHGNAAGRTPEQVHALLRPPV